jgi:SAM-dependent methyltransferase
MNNRQRMIATLVKQQLEKIKGANVYFMEQVTPIYQWAVKTFPQHQIIGSEYLGYEYQSGQVIKGIRHEDVMDLSFSAGSLDLIVSNDVFEHVPVPNKAFAECARVLRRGGVMLTTIPFHRGCDTSVLRAELTAGGLNHFLPPMFHGNPVSAEGSLVFTDFGWDLLANLKESGFTDACVEVFSSETYGHLGGGQLLFKAFK